MDYISYLFQAMLDLGYAIADETTWEETVYSSLAGALHQVTFLSVVPGYRGGKDGLVFSGHNLAPGHAVEDD